MCVYFKTLSGDRSIPLNSWKFPPEQLEVPPSTVGFSSTVGSHHVTEGVFGHDSDGKVCTRLTTTDGTDVMHDVGGEFVRCHRKIIEHQLDRGWTHVVMLHYLVVSVSSQAEERTGPSRFGRTRPDTSIERPPRDPAHCKPTKKNNDPFKIPFKETHIPSHPLDPLFPQKL